MALDPDISLAVAPRGGTQLAGAGAGANPLALIQGYVDTASKLQQLRQFNLQLQARQRAAEILSAAPDMQSGIQAVLHDPIAAFGAGQTLSDYTGAYQALTGVGGAVQQQATLGLGSLIHALNGSLEDSSAAGPIIQSYLQTVSPQARPMVKAAIDRLQGYLGSLPPDQRRRVLASTMMGGGLGPEVIRQTTGELPPQLVPTPGGARIPVGGPGTGNIPAPGGANALGVPGAELSAPGATFDHQIPPIAPGGAPVAPPAGAGALAGDGKPLLPPAGQMVAPTLGTGVGGVPVMSETQASQAEQLGKDYSGQGLRDLNSAETTLASLRYMDNTFDMMAKGGGFLVPGTAADARASLARFANTVAQITGTKPMFDPEKVATIEDLNKETRRMGFMVVNNMFGGSREAAETIMNATASVPNVENSYMGGKLVSEGIRMAMQRVIDLRNFQQAWMNQNKGNLTGSIEAFNRLHPAQEYADQALGKFGLTPQGMFQSPAAIRQAWQQGYLTREQAISLARQQFPGGPGATPGGSSAR